MASESFISGNPIANGGTGRIEGGGASRSTVVGRLRANRNVGSIAIPFANSDATR